MSVLANALSSTCPAVVRFRKASLLPEATQHKRLKTLCFFDELAHRTEFLVAI